MGGGVVKFIPPKLVKNIPPLTIGTGIEVK